VGLPGSEAADVAGGSALPLSSGQKPGAMGRFISASIGAIGVKPTTGSAGNEPPPGMYE
jgi:hypothetical protein